MEGITMNELEELIRANDCEEDRFFPLLHKTLLLFVLEEVCQKLKNNSDLKAQVRSDFRKTTNPTRICLKLVKDICGTTLPVSDALLISTWIQAL